jgi:hypothetical protein
MPPLAVKLVFAALFAVAVTVVVRKALGPDRRKDAVLFSGALIAVSFVLAGAIGVVLGERDAYGAMAVGVLVGLGVLARWRQDDPEPPRT